MKIVIVLLLFVSAILGSHLVQGQARFNPQPLVSFASWPKSMPFRALDVQDRSALIEVEVKPVSSNCEVLENCFPLYRLEHWRLPNLTLEGATEEPVKLGTVIAARLAGTEGFIFYRDQFAITDEALNVLEHVPYPEKLKSRLDHGSPTIGVSASGGFVMIDAHLWDRQRQHWHLDQRWKLVSPDILMGNKRVMALGSFHSGEVWLITYAEPKRAKRFRVQDFQRAYLSHDERRLLIEQRNGLNRLIDVEDQEELQHWTQQGHYQQINWRYNRSLAIERNGSWALYQIEPHRVIARGLQSKDGYSIVAEQQPIGVFLDPALSTVMLIDLRDGRRLSQQKLPELEESYAWLSQEVPLAYSRQPLTLLLGSDLSKRNIQQFRPYQLEMQANGQVIQ